MNAYLISIGDELLIGQTINSNVAFIGSLISDNNISIIKSTVIGDDRKTIIDELQYASSKADIIICTGGLGPTHDDVTRSAVLQYFDTELQFNGEVLEDIKSMLERRGRQLKKGTKIKQWFPKLLRLYEMKMEPHQVIG